MIANLPVPDKFHRKKNRCLELLEGHKSSVCQKKLSKYLYQAGLTQQRVLPELFLDLRTGFMAHKGDLFWELGEELSEQSWVIGECIKSPLIKKNGSQKWLLCFYPAGDDDNPGSLVFYLERDDADERISVKLQFHLCHLTVPVKSYTVNCSFDHGENSFKCILADVENISKLNIFIPLSTLCVRVFLNLNGN
ncbi:uncharacterized protein NPIL_285021 [Nephila pilipes]|uniref:Uncharacterized protein n=1 Tax=Nephila pilipes TaxID=299642 RepID=A0A8X6NW80_NEPPI|nr:uncharacterized protein NPIL_285021 [Nephila pilipes]